MREIAIIIKQVGQPLKTKQHSCIFFTLTVRKSYVFLKGKFHQKRNLGKKKKSSDCVPEMKSLSIVKDLIVVEHTP